MGVRFSLATRRPRRSSPARLDRGIGKRIVLMSTTDRAAEAADIEDHHGDQDHEHDHGDGGGLPELARGEALLVEGRRR